MGRKHACIQNTHKNDFLPTEYIVMLSILLEGNAGIASYASSPLHGTEELYFYRLIVNQESIHTCLQGLICILCGTSKV